MLFTDGKQRPFSDRAREFSTVPSEVIPVLISPIRRNFRLPSLYKSRLRHEPSHSMHLHSSLATCKMSTTFRGPPTQPVLPGSAHPTLETAVFHLTIFRMCPIWESMGGWRLNPVGLTRSMRNSWPRSGTRPTRISFEKSTVSSNCTTCFWMLGTNTASSPLIGGWRLLKR
ncbi:hypothetical protein NPIL_434451 [Nephila pilipes]|uniref:Uncharacterized protein n=1 Tax=Nephila pilipes TaxID=299642 RepID=A0A8X6MFB5_NEPPI|nr:hypothetical protein NPIL_392021 [Nephila pilipes]GFU12931.1 hypothetical protein NPIL_434451 [Nephila pilipes]